MKNKYVALLTLPIFVLTGCKATDELSVGLKKFMLAEPQKEVVNRPDNYNSFLEKVYKFGAKFTEATLKDKDNVSNYAVSPVSVFMALAMTVESTSGETRQEILNALDLTYKELEENIQYFINNLNIDFSYTNYDNENKIYGGIKLTNSIWFQKGFSIKEKLIEVLSKLYYSYSFQTDFNKENGKSNKLVRSFIKEQTNGLIDQNLELDVSTLVVLLNTLYFKDTWNDDGINLSFTNEKYPFTMEDSSQKSINLLKGYYNNGKAVFEEKYRSFYTETNAGATLTFVVPNDGYSLCEVFTKDTILECMNRKYVVTDDEKMEMYHTNCYFPEFEASYDKTINNILTNDFGINKAFSPNEADFSKTSNEPLYLDNVKHIVKLNVNKTGIEGAAITAMIECGASQPVYTDVYETFVVDRSFGYVLSYGGPLFTGVVQTI